MLAKSNACALILVTTLMLTGCQSLRPASEAACANLGWVETTIYFGRSRPIETQEMAAAWKDFVAKDITPKFPDGFTVYDARGAWANSITGTTIYEGSKVLVVLHPGSAETDSKVVEVAQAYRTQFRQQAVLSSDQPACVTFHTASSATGS